MELPVRKPNRMRGYDYSRPGLYFLTVCTRDKRCLFWENPGRDLQTPEELVLTEAGQVLKAAIEGMADHYATIQLDNYVIMPNHFHLLLCLEAAGPEQAKASISQAIGQLKRTVSMALGQALWQKSFHDHVVRNEKDYQRIWEYIHTNPMRWAKDCFFVE
mgnify:CR=1 FL=1